LLAELANSVEDSRKIRRASETFPLIVVCGHGIQGILQMQAVVTSCSCSISRCSAPVSGA
jgi:hypothetical protein